jgi:putative restriction endonuclease
VTRDISALRDVQLAPRVALARSGAETPRVPDQRDLDLRRAALGRVRELQRRYDDLVPLDALRQGFSFRDRRISLGSFYSGIFRAKEMAGPAALAIVTTPPKEGRPPPYEDEFDHATGRFTYRFRDPSSSSQAAIRQADADNRALLAAHELVVPLIYFRGIAPGQYAVVAPVFVTSFNDERRLVEFEAALPIADTGAEGLLSEPDLRRYATREALVRLHQHRFRAAVLHAYADRCAVCALREAALLQAAHIIDDRDPAGAATVVNGIALCAIHHLAYDRNLMGIDPDGMVHISRRLLDEVDGPMLSNGLQGFHGAAILQPRHREERPDPERLEQRFQQFASAA